jgi:hypothetical protein
MSHSEYIPKKESVFYPWAKNLVQGCIANGVRWMVPPEETGELSTFFNTYEAKYQIALTPATRTKITVQAKNDAKKAFTAVLRRYSMGHLLHNKLVTHDDRKLLQLPIYDPTPTPKPVPVTYPMGLVDTSTPQRHTLRVTDSKEVRPRGGLPTNVNSFEVWRKVGGSPPENEADFTYLATSTTSSLTVNYSLAEVGQRVCVSAGSTPVTSPDRGAKTSSAPSSREANWGAGYRVQGRKHRTCRYARPCTLSPAPCTQCTTSCRARHGIQIIPRSRSSKALSAALAPSPMAMTICL